MSCEYLAGKAFPRNTHETFCSASLYCLIHTFCILTMGPFGLNLLLLKLKTEN